MEPWLIRAARMHPERVALATPERDLTYRELAFAARAAGGALLARGVQPGDRVGLALPSAQLIVALHGCLLIGAVAVPVDLRLRAAEQATRTAACVLTLTELPTSDPAGELASDPTGARTIAPAPVRPLQLDAVATLMFTSGTTGGPKPVSLTLSNWLWNALGSTTALGLDPAERWLCPMPLAHVGGLSIALRSAIYGTTVVLHERFDTEAALAVLRDPEQRVTLVSLVPTMLARLLDAGLREPPTLRRVLLGGGPIAPALLARSREAGVAVSPSFGMTETCSQIATDGWPLLGAELSLGGPPPAQRGAGGRDADGREPVVGELLVRGPSVSAGALSHDGWLHTGDLARFDDAGRLEIVGRTADTIISGGENVAPAEVEAALAAHPALADAAVLGRPDAEWGETVVAQVVVREGAPAPDDAELRAWCAERLAPFKVPKRFERVDLVPRGVTGKLLRGELR